MGIRRHGAGDLGRLKQGAVEHLLDGSSVGTISIGRFTASATPLPWAATSN